MSNPKQSTLQILLNPKTIAAYVSIFLVVAAAFGVISQNQASTGIGQLNDLTDKVAELEANQTRTQIELLEAQANLTALQNQLDQPVGSTLSASRKESGFIVSFATNYGVPDRTLTVASGVNGSMVLLGSSATNYTYIAEKAINLAHAINGSITFCEGNYTTAAGVAMVIPTIPVGVMVTIDSGAYGYTFGTVSGTLNDYHNLDFYTNGTQTLASYSPIVFEENGVYKAQTKYSNVFASSDNLTDVTLTALESGITGSLLLNEVVFDLALFDSIPQYVSVVESVNGWQRTFGNIADTQGSPYIVSVEDTQYYAEDRMGTIRFTSSVAVTTINAAIAACTTGGQVHISEGTYPITRISSNYYGVYINVPNLWLSGDGNKTVLRMADSNQANCIYVASGGDNVVISDLAQDGNHAGNTAGGVEANQNGVYFSGVTDGVIRNCYVYNNEYTGVAFDGSSSFCTIKDCTLEGNLWYGSTSHHGIGNIYFTHNLCVNNVMEGLHGCNGYRNSYTDNTVIGGNYGIHANGCIEVVIANNHCENQTYQGILLDFINNASSITGNVIIGSGANGIQLVNSSYCTVSGNTMRSVVNSGVSSQWGYGNTIVGNTVNASATYGIIVQLEAYDTIGQNTIGKTAFTGISLTSTDYATVSGNTISDTTTVGQANGIQVVTSVGVSVVGNTMQNIGLRGIDFTNVDYSTIANNVIRFSKYDGIQLYDDCVWNSITGNIVTDSSQVGQNLADGITINTNCLNNTIGLNNVNSALNAYAVRFHATAQGNMLTDNMLLSGGVSYVTGDAGNIVRNNNYQ